MQHLCTLIADRTTRVITPAVRAKAAEVLDRPVRANMLSDHAAYDLVFDRHDGDDDAALADAVRHALDPLPIDVVLHPADARRKGLFLADMDSTMIEQECIDELAAELGLKERIAAIAERARRGELAFEPALRERVAMLAGLSEQVIDAVYRDRITFTPGGKALLATMRTNGTHCVLVSGGFTHFTTKVATALGFHADHANILQVEDGKLNGMVAEPIQGREAKRQHLETYAAKLGIELSATMAIGDGANDLGMIKRAGLGVAFHAKPAVDAEAHAAIRFGDLTAALYLQGYRDEDIVTPD